MKMAVCDNCHFTR